MTRNEYLQMCQKASVLPEGVLGIKKDVPDELKVRYNNNIYYPLAYMLSFDLKGNATHHCVLHAIESNSTDLALLSDIDAY